MVLLVVCAFGGGREYGEEIIAPGRDVP